MKRRIILIGLDGVPFEMLDDFAGSGVMPHLKKLIDYGVFKPMQSSIPAVSSVAWSSIITGCNPGEHGIYGFTDLYPQSYRLRFPNYADVQVQPFWDQIHGQSIIINVPSTYPVRAMRGVHISGFVSIDFQRSVYPPRLIRELKELDYRLDVESEKAHQSMDLFLKDLDKTLETRIAAYKYLWSNESWNTFMLVFTGTDRLMHFLWDAYENKDHYYNEQFLNHFRRIDRVIGEMTSKMNQEDIFIMMSDHGFETLEYDININWILSDAGLLSFTDPARIEWGGIAQETKAFALDPARIYLNKVGKYPRGSVQKQEYNELLEKLEELFRHVQVDGRPVIRDIYRKQDLFKGSCVDQAPDMVLVAESGFNLRSNIRARTLADRGLFTGKHTGHNAFSLQYGNSDFIHKYEISSVFDISNVVIQSHLQTHS